MDVETRESVIRKLYDRKRITFIAEAYNVPRAHVIQTGLDEGLIHDARNDLMLAQSAAVATATPHPGITAPPPVDGDLLTRTANFRDKTVQRLRQRVTDAMTQLRARVAQVEAAEARHRQAERERATLRNKETQLLAELAAIKAQLRPSKAAAPKAVTEHRSNASNDSYQARLATVGASTAEIRAWAKANGIDVPDKGARVKNEIVDAYEAAHTTTLQGATA